METTLRSRVAKLKKQTNSNLLGMDRAAVQNSATIMSTAGRPYFFLGWARPESSKQQARKLTSLTRPGLWDIIRFKNERKK